MDKQCPYCAETIKAEAIKCRYCHSNLSAPYENVARDAGTAPVLAAREQPLDETALRYEAEKKSAGIAYFLWLVFGTFGGHRYYMGNDFGLAVSMSAIAMVSLFLLFVGGAGSGGILLLGMVGYGVVGVWALIDAFQISGWVKASNSALINQLKAFPSQLSISEQVSPQRGPIPPPPSQISISICPKCRAHGSGNDTECGRCGHVFALVP